MASHSQIRIASGLHAMTHGMSWCGVQAGVFAKHRLTVNIAASEVGGPEAVAGLTRGDWEFCHTGTLPVAENFLNGGDAVALFRHTLPHVSQFVATRRELTALAQLAGKRVGVLSDAATGQTSVSTRVTVEQAGASATYVPLGHFQNIFDALARREIDAGVLPMHMRFTGERLYGWNVFDIQGIETIVPSVFATTRKLVACNRDLVMRVARAYLESVQAFKTQPAVYIPLVQRFLNIDSVKAAEALYGYYVPLFPPAPRMALGAAALHALREHFSPKYPAAQTLCEPDFADSSFIDELEDSGFIRELYTGIPGVDKLRLHRAS